jgi:hypothetical protein
MAASHAAHSSLEAELKREWSIVDTVSTVFRK